MRGLETDTTTSACSKRRSSQILAVACCSITLVLLLGFNSDTVADSVHQAHTAVARLSWQHHEPDLYTGEGYMWWSDDVKQTRFVPYDEGSLSEEFEVEKQIMDPPETALARAPPQFNLWSTLPGASKDERLDFMRNQHVAFNCDSHCTGIVKGFCSYHQEIGAEFTEKGHVSTVCHIPSMNFTLSNFFHFGTVEEGEDWFRLPDPHPYGHTERLAKLHMPLVEQYGQPSLIIFDSNYWDAIIYEARAKHFGYSKQHPASRRGYTYRELAHHRHRVTAMLSTLRETFPTASMMWKPAHPRAWSTMNIGVDGRRGSADIEHINHSTRSLMKHLQIPVMEWAEKVRGTTAYKDWGHYKETSAQNWLAADMVLYYLSRL